MRRFPWMLIGVPKKTHRTFLFVGPLFFAVGLLLVISQQVFILQSEPARALVTEVEEKTNSDRKRVYRPTFQLTSGLDKGMSYTGKTWVSPKPHDAGDEVDVRVRSATGVIRSDKMLKQLLFIGTIFAFVGGFVGIRGFREHILNKD